MTLEAQVRELLAAKKPADALVAVARAIDELRASADAIPAADPWVPSDTQPLAGGGEGPATSPSLPHWDHTKPDEIPAEVKERHAQAVRDLGPPPSHGDELAAWEARRKLVDDILLPPTLHIGTLDTMAQVVQTGPDKYEVVLPPPTPEKAARRREFAERVGLGDDGWDPDPDNPPSTPMVDAYVKGGPLWLYSYSRKFCTTLNVDQLYEMLHDLNEDSPGDAKNFGQDLLKQEDDMGHAMAAAEAASRNG